MAKLPKGITLRDKPLPLAPGETPASRLASMGLTLGTGSPAPPVTIKDTTQAAVRQPSGVEGTFTDVKTGRPSGVSRGGETFFISGEDLSLFQQQQAQKNALSGSAGMGTIAEAAAQRADTQVRQQLLSGVGSQQQLGGVPGVEALTAPLITKTTAAQALAAGVTAAGTTAAATAITGPLSIPAAAAAGITVAIGTFISKITVEQRQNVKEANAIFQQTQQNMLAIINRLNGDMNYSPEQAIRDWNEELYNLEIAGINLRKLSNSATRKALSGGGDEMIRYNLWKSGEFPSMQAKFNNAFLVPNPQAPFLTFIPEAE